MSVFLMGVYDKSCDQWRTVAKCGNGHDDATIERLQKELNVIKISKVVSCHGYSQLYWFIRIIVRCHHGYGLTNHWYQTL